MWVNTILLATFLNGIALASMKAIHYYKQSESVGIFFLSLYTASALLSITNLKFKEVYFKKEEILIGVSLGISLILGIICVTLALKDLMGCFVYPIVNGGAVVIISIMAWILFKERYSIFGILGIGIGIISIVLLSL